MSESDFWHFPTLGGTSRLYRSWYVDFGDWTGMWGIGLECGALDLNVGQCTAESFIISAMEEILHQQQDNEAIPKETLEDACVTSGDEDEKDSSSERNDEDNCSEWEEDQPIPIPESLQRPGKKYLKSISNQHLMEEDEREFRELLFTEGTTPTVINTIISVTNRFLNFKVIYQDDYPKSQGFNRKVMSPLSNLSNFFHR